MPARRFPPSWTVEELDACFVVRDHNSQQLAYVCFEDEPGRQIGEPLRNGLNEQSIGLNYQATAAPFGILRREFSRRRCRGNAERRQRPHL